MSAFEPKVSIIIVSYNTREMTLECLRSVRAEIQVPYELILVDNASTDGSAEAIAREFPDINFMPETDNHGFAKANNIAAERAQGEYILLLNPDTVVLNGAIDKLVAFAEQRPEAKLWGGRTLYGDGTVNRTSCFQRMSLWSVFCQTSGLTGVFPKSEFFHSETYGEWDRDTERQVDIVTGCFLLIQRENWEALDGFDRAFFMYGEETDLCLRAIRDLGAEPRVTPDATIIHYGGASEKLRAERVVRLMGVKIQIIQRHIPASQRYLVCTIFRLWPLTRKWAFRLLNRNGESGRIWNEVWSRRAEWWRGFFMRLKIGISLEQLALRYNDHISWGQNRAARDAAAICAIIVQKDLITPAQLEYVCPLRNGSARQPGRLHAELWCWG